MAEERGEKAVVASGPLDFGFYGALFGMLAQGVERHFPDDSEVLRGVVLAGAGGIFEQGDVEHPVELVFDGPVSSGDLKYFFGRQHCRQQEEANDRVFGFSGALTMGFDPCDGRQAGEIDALGLDDDGSPGLDAVAASNGSGDRSRNTRQRPRTPVPEDHAGHCQPADPPIPKNKP
jgi:hypothetical protein